MVLMRAISRRMARNWSGLAIASVPRRNASRKRSSASTASFCSSSSVLSSRNCSGFCGFAILALLPPHELGLERQLGRRQRQGRPRDLLRHPFDLEDDPARLHHRHPAFGVPLPFAHARLGWLLGDRLVGKEPRDRKSTRLNSSHGYISYAVFCLKKKKQKTA